MPYEKVYRLKYDVTMPLHCCREFFICVSKDENSVLRLVSEALASRAAAPPNCDEATESATDRYTLSLSQLSAPFALLLLSVVIGILLLIIELICLKVLRSGRYMLPMKQ